MYLFMSHVSFTRPAMYMREKKGRGYRGGPRHIKLPEKRYPISFIPSYTPRYASLRCCLQKRLEALGLQWICVLATLAMLWPVPAHGCQSSHGRALSQVRWDDESCCDAALPWVGTTAPILTSSRTATHCPLRQEHRGVSMSGSTRHPNWAQA